MLALRELPEKDKNILCPLFRLRPWVGSNKLQNSVDKIVDSFGKRPCYLEVGDEELVDPLKRREVHDELDSLRSSDHGYENWFQFLAKPEHSFFRPALQTRSAGEFADQANKLASLNRGLLLRVSAPQLSLVNALSTALIAPTSGGGGLIFLLDFGKQGHDFAHSESSIKALIQAILAKLPKAIVAVSASSFPESFTSISKQEIFERSLCEKLLKSFSATQLIFSDRGSARAEKQLGGGGLPAPRIDHAGSREWIFFRDDRSLGGTSFQAYQRQAKALMSSSFWDLKLKLWACQMIEKTANGDEKGGISSPNRSTAARINMHLHRQLHFADQVGFYDTDEDWDG